MTFHSTDAPNGLRKTTARSHSGFQVQAPLQKRAVGIFVDDLNLLVGKLCCHSFQLFAFLRALFDKHIFIEGGFDLKRPSYASLSKLFFGFRDFGKEAGKSAECRPPDHSGPRKC
jgi:hypothetical protein